MPSATFLKSKSVAEPGRGRRRLCHRRPAPPHQSLPRQAARRRDQPGGLQSARTWRRVSRAVSTGVMASRQCSGPAGQDGDGSGLDDDHGTAPDTYRPSESEPDGSWSCKLPPDPQYPDGAAGASGVIAFSVLRYTQGEHHVQAQRRAGRQPPVSRRAPPRRYKLQSTNMTPVIGRKDRTAELRIAASSPGQKTARATREAWGKRPRPTTNRTPLRAQDAAAVGIHAVGLVGVDLAVVHRQTALFIECVTTSFNQETTSDPE